MDSENEQNQSYINHHHPPHPSIPKMLTSAHSTYERNGHMFDHSILHCNSNSMYKQKELNNATSNEHVISDTLYKHMMAHKINCLVDTRLSPKGNERLHHSFGRKFFIVNSVRPADASHRPRAEIAILVSKAITNHIDYSGIYKIDDNDGYRAAYAVYHDKILAGKVLIGTFYNPPTRKVDTLIQLTTYLTNKITKHKPDYVILTTDANIHLDNPHKKTTAFCNAFLYDNNLLDVFRTIHPDKSQNPGYTFPARANTNNDHTRIDYLFMSPSLIESKSSLSFICNATIDSDHRGLS